MEGIGKGLGCAFLIAAIIGIAVGILGWEAAKWLFHYIANHLSWK